MRWRRNRRGSDSTEHANIEGAPASDSSRPAALPQEVSAHIPFADVTSKPALLSEALAVVVPDQHEHESPLATELLETVSTTSIQLHPTGPAEPASAPGESGPSADLGEAEASRAAISVPPAAPGDTTPAYTEAALAADEPDLDPQGPAVPAGMVPDETSVESRNSVSPQDAIVPDASSEDEVSVGASRWRGRATSQVRALAGPLEFAHAAVRANVTVWSYLRKEGDAALAHLRAVSRAKSPTDLMDLQVSEMTRAHGAALKLGQDLVNAAGHSADGPSSASNAK
jgi:hypothetical protein